MLITGDRSIDDRSVMATVTKVMCVLTGKIYQSKYGVLGELFFGLYGFVMSYVLQGRYGNVYLPASTGNLFVSLVFYAVIAH